MKQEVFCFIKEELKHVELVLRQVVASGSPEIRQIGSYILNNGGKRLRPALFLAVAHQRRKDLSPYIDAAAALELVHTASLLHDDVIDRASSRRGKPSVNVRWSNKVSVLTGDFLLSKAFQLFLTYRNWPLMELFSRVVQEMAEGEIEQVFTFHDPWNMEERYFKWISKKTARFFSGCCQAGSMLSGGNKTEQSLWADFGFNLGMAFQLIDDLLDYTGDIDSTGKARFGDLQNKVLTLPLIYTLRCSRERASLYALLSSEIIKEENLKRVTGAVVNGDGTEYTFKRAGEFAQRAGEVLAEITFPDHCRKDNFLEVVSSVLCRNK